jgi:hypothetical protein
MTLAKQNHLYFVLAMTCCQINGCSEQQSSDEPHGTVTTANAPSGAFPAQSPAIDRDESQVAHKPPTLDRKEIASDIVTVLGAVPTDDLSASQWRMIRSRYWCKGFDAAIQQPGDSKSLTVKDLLRSATSKEPLALQLTSGTFTSVTDAHEQEALMALHSLVMMSAMKGGHSLPVAIGELAKNSTPTRGDVFLFEIFDDAFVEMGNTHEVSPADWQAWVNMTQAQNPIHRLLALRTFRKVSTDSSQWLDFYGNYVAEQDHAILAELITHLFESGKPDAAKVLTGLQTNPEIVASPDLTARVKRAQQIIDRLQQPR